MASPFPSRNPADPLSLFEPEQPDPTPDQSPREGTSGNSPSSPLFLAPEPETVLDDVDFPGFADDPRRAGDAKAPEPGDHPDVSVEVMGPPPPADAVSFDHVRAVKDLHFVEGVAMVQATCETVSAARPSAGVPAVDGLFLTAAGDVVPHGPPTGEPPARELARLLHQLVTPQAVPAAGRLFVGRWINSTGSLTEFASELAYFARPNGRELLRELHARSHGVPAPVRTAVPEVRRPQPARIQPRAQVDAQPSPVASWIREHYATVLAGVVVLAAGAAIVAWLSQSPSTPEARPLPPISSGPVETPAPENLTPEAAPAPVTPPAAPPAAPGTARNTTPPRTTQARPTVGGNSAPVPPSPSQVRGGASPALIGPIQSQDAARGIGPSPPVPAPPAPEPDINIYSAANADVEPPRLLSAEILGQLLSGFPKRTNEVEIVVGERGDVQTVQMIGPPQRFPDVMSLSRVKELRYAPAVRNGRPVRYRLRLTWNVTP